jgi:plastocyanin domain-containing protein
MMGSTDANPDVPPCYQCSGKGKPPVTEGTATVQNGAQVVNIRIENGYYVPSKITVKAGMPTTAIFTGKAKDCVGKPKFGSLSKQIDIRNTGTGTIDLGSLSAGSYTFSCGMGANQGSIVAQ